jgi:hypothetical protein
VGREAAAPCLSECRRRSGAKGNGGLANRHIVDAQLIELPRHRGLVTVRALGTVAHGRDGGMGEEGGTAV